MDTDWRAEDDEESPGEAPGEGTDNHELPRDGITSEDEFARADEESTSDDELVQAQGATEADSGDEVLAEGGNIAPDQELAPRVAHSLIDVLLPANPPKPKNARIIRRFDLEAARFDPRPATAAPAAPEKKPETLSREEARALRNRSLRAAARLE